MKLATARVGMIVAAALAATGCAAEARTEGKGQSHAAEELPGAGGGDDVAVDDGTFYLEVDQRTVFYDNSGGGAIIVGVCDDADPNVIAQIKRQMDNPSHEPHLVLKKQDGSYDTRQSEVPQFEPDVYYCGGGHGGLYKFQLWGDPNADFIRNFDLSKAFVNGISG